MALRGDRFFGFNTTQRHTLANLLKEVQGADQATINKLIKDLEALTKRVDALEP